MKIKRFGHINEGVDNLPYKKQYPFICEFKDRNREKKKETKIEI